MGTYIKSPYCLIIITSILIGILCTLPMVLDETRKIIIYVCFLPLLTCDGLIKILEMIVLDKTS